MRSAVLSPQGWSHLRRADEPRLVAAALFALAVATRLPFRTALLFNWDAANFAFALERFDVTQHAPHPPGYFLYVLAAKLLLPLLGEANAALTTVSMLLDAGAVAATYLLGRALFSPAVGLAAALLLLTSVTFWSYGAVALAYPALALFAALIAALVAGPWRTRGRLGRERLLGIALLYGVGSGFRPDLLLWLAPLVGWGLLRAERPSHALLAALVAAATVAAWLLPTVLLSGGPQAYAAVLSAYLQRDVVERYAAPARGLPGLFTNARDSADYFAYALYAAALPLAGALLFGLRRWREVLRDLRTPLFVLWLLPQALFLPLIHAGDPGYVFATLPALLTLAAAWTMRGLPENKPAWALVSVVIVLNSAIFLFHQRPLTGWGLRQHDAVLAETLGTVRACCQAERTVLIAYESFKLARYYLREYQVLWADLTAPQEFEAFVPAHVDRVVLLDRSLFPLVHGAPVQPLPLRAGGALGLVPVQPGQRLVYGGPQLRFEPPPAR
jgi:hypothetical protein